MRDVRSRVALLAPFIDFDSDPYPVIVDGQMKWVIDGYTTTSDYPYSQRADTDQLPPGSGLDHRFNYARNSVKAVVDAYNGDVTLLRHRQHRSDRQGVGEGLPEALHVW